MSDDAKVVIAGLIAIVFVYLVGLLATIYLLGR